MQEVWVVSGNGILCRAAARLLECEGYAVKVLERAAEALSLAGAGKPHALVVEDRLPDAGAFELVAALRALPGERQTRCLVFTQDRTADRLAFRERVLRAGCFPLERFPPDSDELIDILGYALAELPAEGQPVMLRVTEGSPDVACVAADVVDSRTVLLLLANPYESFRNAFRPHASLRFRYATADGVAFEWIARMRAFERDWAEVEVLELAERRTPR